jgi:hypothetical protein
MSTNRNIKNADFREVFIADDDTSGASKQLLNDLVNTGAPTEDQVIASIFLMCVKSVAPITNDPKAHTEKFLVLKPRCLWLSNQGGLIISQNGSTSTSISMFQGYTKGEKIKISFLQRPFTVEEILVAQGVTGVAGIKGNDAILSRVFTYDANESNRTRSASISTTGNATLNSRWL